MLPIDWVSCKLEWDDWASTPCWVLSATFTDGTSHDWDLQDFKKADPPYGEVRRILGAYGGQAELRQTGPHTWES